MNAYEAGVTIGVAHARGEVGGREAVRVRDILDRRAREVFLEPDEPVRTVAA